MNADQARQIAHRVSARVDPGRVSVALTVDGGNEAKFVMWIERNGKIEQNTLDAASTSEQRLEAHLRGFCENAGHHYQ